MSEIYNLSRRKFIYNIGCMCGASLILPSCAEVALSDRKQFNIFSEEHSSDIQKGTKSYNREDLVFVLTDSKQKDEILNKADVKLELRKRILSNGGFSEVKPILGKKLKRSLKKGSILKEKHLMKDWLVHKNQKIEIENQVGSIKVTMQGLALSNGLKGDRIFVKNL